MSDITAIKRSLSMQVQAVAEMLLPGGKRDGQEWRAGSTGGESGKSLGVHLSGDKAGVWSDFSTGESGDLIDLWRAARNLSLTEALDQARQYCGMTRPEPYQAPHTNYERPAKPRCTAPTSKVLGYLREDRNLPDRSIEAYKVAADGDTIIFPYLLPDKTLAMAKARKAEAGASPKPTASNCEPILFGWQAVPDDARQIIITEGEIDAMSWHAYGYPAMSVPFGGGKGAKQKWIESEYDRLERFERIYISTDMDPVGEEAAVEIINRLGRHRCYRITLPYKDANECLVEGVAPETMDAAMKSAKSYDPDGLRHAVDYIDEVTRLFWPSSDEHVGYRTPYGKLGDKIAFRPAEVTVWTGASGSGKSQIISDCTVHWIDKGSRVCIASLEMKPAQTLKRMCKQAGGVDRPTEQYIRGIVEWLDQGLMIYERVGKAGVEALLAVFDYARAKYGCDQFIIDSLMRLGIAGDDYNGQEKAVFQIIDWAIKSNVHVHLVAHARKGEAGKGVPDTEDVKGAMEIGANAFNILAVWRNRDQEEKLRVAKNDAERKQIDERPGVILNVAKQRNGDFEGKIGLWFDQDTYQYHSSFDRGMWGRRYVQGSYPREEAAA